MSAVNLARAHLAVVMCFVNISLAMAFWKLSLEMKTHGQLQKSHAALQKQAAGISQEYSRITATMPASMAASETDTNSSTSNAELAATKVPSGTVFMKIALVIQAAVLLHMLVQYFDVMPSHFHVMRSLAATVRAVDNTGEYS